MTEESITAADKPSIAFGSPSPAQSPAVISYSITVEHPPLAPIVFNNSMKIDCVASISQCSEEYKNRTARLMAAKFYDIVRALLN